MSYFRYRHCKWCRGNGCIFCHDEAEKEYQRQFPDGPKPIATFKTDDPADMERAKRAIGGDAIAKAFGPGGGGVEEIIHNCEEAAKEQERRNG